MKKKAPHTSLLPLPTTSSPRRPPSASSFSSSNSGGGGSSSKTQTTECRCCRCCCSSTSLLAAGHHRSGTAAPDDASDIRAGLPEGKGDAHLDSRGGAPPVAPRDVAGVHGASRQPQPARALRRGRRHARVQALARHPLAHGPASLPAAAGHCPGAQRQGAQGGLGRGHRRHRPAGGFARHPGGADQEGGGGAHGVGQRQDAVLRRGR